MLPELGWLAKAREQYQTPAETNVRVETNFGRASGAIKSLQEKVLPNNSHPNILLVGIGYKGGGENPLVCTYSPFVLSAFLESQGVDYRMSIVDIADGAISEARDRKNLYLTATGMAEFTDMKEYWQEYLSWTHQEERVLHEGEEGLIFGYTDRLFPPEFYLEHGVHTAEIPQGFKQKLEAGDISLIEGDIAVADLGSKGFDFADCTNVLYHLPMEGQMLAIANIAAALNPNGLILLNDLGELADNPLFTELGGWLTNDMLKDIGLEVLESETIGEVIQEPRGSYTTNVIWATLRKVA